ncbi:MAG: helix-turn-helix domain-containing protein [Pseudomonadota bacterium]|nr:helix-turn-helix domain-containing protein [Pseudomonadota bacterium]
MGSVGQVIEPGSPRVAPSAAKGHVGEFAVSDPNLFEQSSPPWEIMATPLDKGGFLNRKTYLLTPNVILYEERFGSAVHLRGLTPAGMLGFTVPICLGGRTAYWNAFPENHGLPASLPGALDATIDAGQRHVIVLVRRDLLSRLISPASLSRLETAANRRRLPVTAAGREGLRRGLLDALYRAHRNTGMLDHAAALSSLEEDIVARLMSALALPEAPGRRPALSRRRQGLDRALEYLRSAEDVSTNVPGLCEAAGVSQRTLEYAFRETFGMTPLTFLRLRRLHAARRQLASASPGSTRVADTAYAHGFYEPGRFASIYAACFGELPSETLRRRFPETTTCLLP